jgi:uncharacterized membrane protein
LIDRPSTVAFFIGLVVAAVLSLVVYRHAERQGYRHPTAWGIAVFFFAGIVTPAYFIVHYYRVRRVNT